MCGIAGIVSNRDAGMAKVALDRMVAAMWHRGPDGRGAIMRTSDGWNVGVGHTRLSILDLSTLGAQPMTAAGEMAITYNGEVYNFMDLREELKGGGPPFRTGTDTEVILEGYRRWGLDLLPRLRGMFAFAIWDPSKRTLLLARDSLGIKPLYLYAERETVLFASEVRALLASGIVPRRLDREGLSSYLGLGSVSAPRTIIEGIESLMPGDCLEIVLGDSAKFCRSTFRTRASGRQRQPANRAQAVEELRSVLIDSVSRHLVSDVPVGLFLSGGIDSTAIAAILGKELKRPLRSFNVAFAEAEYAEDRFASSVAKRCGIEHSQVFLSESAMPGMMPDAIRSMDQPTMDGVNTWVVSKAVSEAGIKVALSGLGGDELFCGYSSFRRAQMMQRVRHIPRPMRAAAAAAGRVLFDGTVWTSKFWDMLDSQADAAAAYAVSRRLFSPVEVRALAGIEVSQPAVAKGSADVINSVSMLESQGYMTNTLLRDTDFMAMAHALEVRVPFVDAEVVDYVMGLPGEWKMDPARPKPLLLDSLGELIPDDIWRRPKMGFTLPFQKWMRSALRPDMDSVLGRSGDIGDAGIHRGAAGAIWDRFQKTPERERWSRPWSLYVLQKWCDANGVTACERCT